MYVTKKTICNLELMNLFLQIDNDVTKALERPSRHLHDGKFFKWAIKRGTDQCLV